MRSSEDYEVQTSYRNSVKGFAKYVDMGTFTAGQLQVIRYGLENGLDVESYADASLSLDEMYKRFYDLKYEKRANN